MRTSWPIEKVFFLRDVLPVTLGVICFLTITSEPGKKILRCAYGKLV